MIALIDGDIVLYKTGFACDAQDAPVELNLWQAEETIKVMLRELGANSFKVYLSDTLANNYRYKIYPEYKANRKDAKRPKFYDEIKQFLINEFEAEITPGQEADDALGIYQSQNDDTIICSIDKDLLQVPGLHYNFVKKVHTEVEELNGLRHFYQQCLKGDRTDNIPGIDGIGDKKSERLLANCDNEAEMLEVVRGMWDDDLQLTVVGQLLWVRRKPDELWQPPFHLLEEIE
jgi:DNA polymerase-1